MARTVDPERTSPGDCVIIDAGADLLRRATATPAPRRRRSAAQAGIGSGTFFHYFPTEVSPCCWRSWTYGTQETRDVVRGAVAGAPTPPRSVLDAYLRAHRRRRWRTRGSPGFVRAVGAVMGEPDVEAALAARRPTCSSAAASSTWVRARAARPGEVRTDLAARAT